MFLAQNVISTGANVGSGHLIADRKWFAVFTRSHHEKRVVEQLQAKGVESFLPIVKTVHHWTHHRKVTLDLPLFPNYLFVKIAHRERSATLAVSGVLSLVGHGGTPSSLPDKEIERLRSVLAQRDFQPHPYLATGTRARILAGPLAGMEGIVLRSKGHLRVVLSVDLIQQSMSVEVSADELMPSAFPAQGPLLSGTSHHKSI